MNILFRAKMLGTDKWLEGDLSQNSTQGTRIVYQLEHIKGVEYHCVEFSVEPNTVSMFTGHTTCKGNKVWGGTIAFEETETDFGDIREYYVCTWISEWASFIWLPIEEYKVYVDDGVESIDRVFLPLSESHKLHNAGNVFDNANLLENA